MSSLIAKYHGPNETHVDLSMKLFVGQVPKDMDEKDLQPYFEKYGEVMSVKICRDRDSKQHKGCAFITFDNLDHADTALHEMHDRVALPGAKKEMQIKPVHNEDAKKFEKRLFVGMISKSMSVDDLKEMFSKFGEVSDCNVLFNQEKVSRGCGFLKFEKASSCMIAIKEMHHSKTMEGCNSPLVVKHADSPADKQKRQASSASLDDRPDVKRGSFNHAPVYYNNNNNNSQPPPHQYPDRNQYNAPPQPPQQPNSTAVTLINAFTPLLATVAEQNNPGTTKMLVKSIEIALNALQYENSPSAHTALVSIASNLSVAVANNLSRASAAQSSNYSNYSQEYPASQPYPPTQEYQYNSAAAVPQSYPAAQQGYQSNHYNHSSSRPN